MGEVAAFARVLAHTGILTQIQEQVRFARARFGQYELIDFVAVLLGYMLSGEPTLLAFYERLTPWADAFMALFGRNRLPHRSILSRYLSALDQASVEALRTLFQKDALARKPFPSPGGLFDRTDQQWIVIAVDGTRQAARQRALPQTDRLPTPHRRFEQVCAPGYQGRKRGEVVRTRTVVLQAHTHQFLGTFHLLDLDVVKHRLVHAPDQVSTHAESGMTRTLYDCVSVPLTPAGPEVPLVVATHARTSSDPSVGVERDGIVYELFVSTLPSPAFTAADLLELYRHRGSFATVLADEDKEQEMDR
jgi:hypothetical protein